MKTKINTRYLIALGTLASASAFAQSPKQISSEMEITRARGALIIRDIQRGSAASTLQNADFLRKSRDLTNAMNQELKNLEDLLQNKIFNPQFKAYVQKFTDIAHDKQYSVEEKKNLLEPIKVQLQAKLNEMSVPYRAQILKFYQLAGDLPVIGESINRGTRETSDWQLSTRSIITNQISFEMSRNTYNADYYYYGGPGAPKLYPALAKDCYSQTCIGLTASLDSFYIASVKKNLDRKITLPLVPVEPGDDEGVWGEIELKGLDFEAKSTAAALQSTIEYPADYYKLPFDLAEGDYERAKAATTARREQEIADRAAAVKASTEKRNTLIDLAVTILSKRKGFDSCPSEVSGYADAIDQIAKLSTAEIAQIETSIETNVPARILNKDRNLQNGTENNRAGCLRRR